MAGKENNRFDITSWYGHQHRDNMRAGADAPRHWTAGVHAVSHVMLRSVEFGGHSWDAHAGSWGMHISAIHKGHAKTQ